MQTNESNESGGRVDADDDELYEERMSSKFCAESQMRKEAVSPDDLEQEFRRFEDQYIANQMSSKSSLLDFWNDKETKSNYPILAKLAEIVLAAPGTQVSVEELFSQLKFLLNDQRESMDSVTVNNVLIV